MIKQILREAGLIQAVRDEHPSYTQWMVADYLGLEAGDKEAWFETIKWMDTNDIMRFIKKETLDKCKIGIWKQWLGC